VKHPWSIIAKKKKMGYKLFSFGVIPPQVGIITFFEMNVCNQPCYQIKFKEFH